MTMAILAWILAIPLLGFATGMRSMTGIAVFCWFAYLGYMPIHHDWAFWTTKLVTVAVFTVFALGEFVGDKLPKTPNRTSAIGLIARLAFGGLLGALSATALKGSAVEGIILGALGALLGTFISFHCRRDLVKESGWADWKVAIVEDLLAVLLAIFSMGIITG